MSITSANGTITVEDSDRGEILEMDALVEAGRYTKKQHPYLKPLFWIYTPVPGSAGPEPAEPDIPTPRPSEPRESAPEPARPVADKPSAKVPKTKAATPKPKVPYRAPESQNEHQAEIANRLKGKAQHVALMAHLCMGQNLQTGFCSGTWELSSRYLAARTGLSRPTVDASMAEAVEAGLFVRVDNGRGGRTAGNRATYKAVVPDFPDSGN